MQKSNENPRLIYNNTNIISEFKLDNNNIDINSNKANLNNNEINIQNKIINSNEVVNKNLNNVQNTAEREDDINYSTFLKELLNICNSTEDESNINQRLLYYLESLDKFILSKSSKRVDSYNEWIYLTMLKYQIENNKSDIDNNT